MSLDVVIPSLAAAGLVVYLVLRAAGVALAPRYQWTVPAALSALFLVLSVRAVLDGGPLGFWPEHIRNPWGNQIWVDLLLAVSIGWFFMVPKARSVGMRPYPWLVLVVATGSIGFLAMLARLLYLRRDETAGLSPAPSAPLT
jgi:Terpene cyclase DEP1